ncbi:hypothetical protein HYDPIDRAFT_30898 [Hydnomerulius pinastri MD-312]|uniref:F-box domain-containing protein n=1 Tax=Hydnomerulius pinastri MD-312 TaxID=994086 RepID=A0A0C9W597_9AGAM|nr:hypothetical protein HYDPIDRAFT_30898 [Hydnomerulius pinastri MD-312]
MLGQLPIDVLYEIFKFLHVQDIIQIQCVNKRFSQITQERIVWVDAYQRTSLPRPSGPHSWQDTKTLKRRLVRSAKVEKNWPHRGPSSLVTSLSEDNEGSQTSSGTTTPLEPRVYSPTSTRKFTFPFPRPLTLTTIAGRWIVVSTRSGIWCVDLELSEVPHDASEDHVILPVELHTCGTTRLEFSFCVSTTNREGHTVAYVVAEEREDTNLEAPRSISIFKLNLPFGTGDGHRMSAECKGTIPIGEGTLFNAVLAHDLLLIHVVALGTTHRFWVVHSPTDTLYQLISPERVEEAEPSWVSLHVCSTHLMMNQRRHHEATQTWECHIEAYPLPALPPPVQSNAQDGIPEVHLRLSHKGVCPVSMLFSGPALWERGAQKVDKAPGLVYDARVVLVAYRMLSGNPPVPCLAAADLVLKPPESPTALGTVICTLHDIFVPLTTDTRRGLVPHFYTTSRGNESRGIIECSSSISRGEKKDVFGFTLSLEQEEDAEGAMKMSFWTEKLQLPDEPRPCFMLGYDGNVGRMFRRHPNHGKDVVEIIDFA